MNKKIEDVKSWADTILLPKTDFAMRANLPDAEPEVLKYWQKLDLYNENIRISSGREKFTLHDGPPYANGNLHIGHALNKILKDLIVRLKFMMNYDVLLSCGIANDDTFEHYFVNKHNTKCFAFDGTINNIPTNILI